VDTHVAHAHVEKTTQHRAPFHKLPPRRTRPHSPTHHLPQTLPHTTAVPRPTRAAPCHQRACRTIVHVLSRSSLRDGQKLTHTPAAQGQPTCTTAAPHSTCRRNTGYHATHTAPLRCPQRPPKVVHTQHVGVAVIRCKHRRPSHSICQCSIWWGGSPPVHLEAPSTAHQCSMHRNPRHTVHTSAYSTHGHPRRIRHDSHCMKRSVGATVTDASFPVATESVGWDTPTGRCGAGGWRKQHAYMHWWCIASARMHAACARASAADGRHSIL
jgi:hypothetical protein